MELPGYRLIQIGIAAILSVFLWQSALVAQPQSPYQRGLEQLYRGDVDQALKTWEDSYEDQRRVDARIGFEYIRVITEQEFSERFESATQMYYKALLNGTGVNSRIAVRQEIERLKAIVGDGIYRQWTEWWEKEHPELRSDIRGFWIRLDPTPARAVNERLIEHWQRIATARQRFTKNSSTIYGTDERAHLYIRYGEPDRVQGGILTLQDLNLKPWLERQILQRQEITREDPGGTRMETGSGSAQSFSAMQADKLESVMYDNHRYPEYEIWFYDDITVKQRDTVPYIFGTNIRNDQFERLSGIEQFIPERAYNTSAFREQDMVVFTRVGITPALILQMLYYEQLAMIDPYFEQRLNRLQNLLLEQGAEAYSGLDQQFREESKEILRQRSVQAPRQLSTIESKIPSIPTHVYQYRFLDEDNSPYLVTYLESEPREAFMIDFIRNRPEGVSISDLNNVSSVPDLLSNYTLEHSLQEYDANWELINKKIEEPGFQVRRNKFRPGAVSGFRSAHTHRGQRSVSSELKNLNENSRVPALETPYPPATRGLGSLHFREPAPLKSHPDSLQLADLVLGYQMQDEPETIFPFIVANNQTIPWQETLVLHFEVYNLVAQPNGFSRFELTYRILPVDEEGRVLTDQTEFILTLNFTSEERRLIENLEIETANLNTGFYELRVQVSDVNTAQQAERKTRFEVLD